MICESKGASLMELKTDENFYAVEKVLLTYGTGPTYILQRLVFLDLFCFELN